MLCFYSLGKQMDFLIGQTHLTDFKSCEIQSFFLRLIKINFWTDFTKDKDSELLFDVVLGKLTKLVSIYNSELKGEGFLKGQPMVR